MINEVKMQASEIESVVSGLTHDPHQWLGMHKLGRSGGLVVRAWDPGSLSVDLINKETAKSIPMNCLHSAGFYEVILQDCREFFDYSFLSTFKESRAEWIDPYRFLPSVTNQEIEGFNNGWDRRPFEKLGAIPRSMNGVEGVGFVVWAPSAISVHLVGDFNYWNTTSLPMRSLGSSGCRELFVPRAKTGDLYKYRIAGCDGVVREKTDPFGWRFESPAGNASIIEDRSQKRSSLLSFNESAPRKRPISIYEMHIGSWKRDQNTNQPLSYLELADDLPLYLKEMGFTHVEFLPPSEYPYGASWGYQVTGYFAPTYRYGTPAEFSYLLHCLQTEGIGVIIDWVPAHFPSDEFALSQFDGTCLFEHQDPRMGRHAEWGTLCFNYGRAEVKSFLVGSAIAWLERFGVDGFRVDAVASMLYLDYSRKEGEWCPNKYGGNENLEAIEFLKEFNQAIHEEFPNVISIAEESTSFPQITMPPETGGLGFDFKWNMGWMHDVLGYFSSAPADRSRAHNQLTFGAIYQFSENFIQAFSHDEVVHGKGSLVNKMNLAYQEDRIANLRALLALQWVWPGKKTIFMGCEIGQWSEWDFEGSVDWALLDFPLHQGLKKLVSDLNHMYTGHPSWANFDHQPDKFSWVDCNDAHGQTLSFLKYGSYPKDTLLVACNFSGHLVHRDWGCPHPGSWEVILDTDASCYAGQGLSGGVNFDSFNEARNQQPYGLSFSVNRWSVRILRLSQGND